MYHLDRLLKNYHFYFELCPLKFIRCVLKYRVCGLFSKNYFTSKPKRHNPVCHLPKEWWKIRDEKFWSLNSSKTMTLKNLHYLAISQIKSMSSIYFVMYCNSKFWPQSLVAPRKSVQTIWPCSLIYIYWLNKDGYLSFKLHFSLKNTRYQN